MNSDTLQLATEHPQFTFAIFVVGIGVGIAVVLLVSSLLRESHPSIEQQSRGEKTANAMVSTKQPTSLFSISLSPRAGARLNNTVDCAYSRVLYPQKYPRQDSNL